MSHPALSAAIDALSATDVDVKLAAVGRLETALAVSPPPTLDRPCQVVRGVPARPEIVPPGKVARRRPGSEEGHAALLHAIAHIEFTAIDLALDHALRFAPMPAGYCAHWLAVAVEEASHFGLVRECLRNLDSDYGDFPAHDLLWRMAERTADDVLARMALVPRLLEARGLDANPAIRRKLAGIGDMRAAAALDVILRDEIGHVGLGDRWFRHLCDERGLDPESTYRTLVRDYAAPWPQAPLNREARLAAGFTAAELDVLTTPAATG